ncbi:MAG TPA: hypothetical protein VF190_14030 [Rhodothermales bacterium]
MSRVASRSDLKAFVDFPFRLYESYPHWVPPLRRDVAALLNRSKNPFFEHGDIVPFLARNSSGEVVGRIAAIVNGMHLRKYDDAVGFFGFFECVEDPEVARALILAADAELAVRGLKTMRGPANPSLNDVAGLLVGGFDREPSIMMPYNPAYYVDYLASNGFKRVMTMWAYYVHRKYVQTEKLRRGVELVHRRTPGLRIRSLDMGRFRQEASIILDLYNEAWSDNWGHVPMTEREFAHLAKEMKQIVDPRLVFIIEDDTGPVAFSITLPDLNLALKHVRDGRLLPLGLPKLLAYAKFGAVHECRTLLMGVRKKYQGRGLDAVLNLATITEGPKLGYMASELSWVLDSNAAMINSLHAIGAVVDKEYALFDRSITTAA